MKKIPKAAKREINDILLREHHLQADAGERILARYGVRGDARKLQSQYRRTLLHQHMARFRDRDGRRSVLAMQKDGKYDYKLVDLCNDRRELETTAHKFQGQITGLGTTQEKIQERILALDAVEASLIGDIAPGRYSKEDYENE